MKINIKIKNQHGVNSFKGEDLDVSTAQHLMSVAAEMIRAEHFASATPLMQMQVDTLLPAQGIYDTEMDTHAVAPTPIVAPVTKPTLNTPAPLHTDKQVTKPEADSTSQTTTTTMATTHKAPPAPPVEKDEVVYSSPDAPPLNSIGDKLKPGSTSAPVSILSIEERMAEMNKDYFTTGIKYKERNGELVPTYRIRYNCPKCTHQANHYGWENTKNVFCHSCNQPLVVEQATKKFLERDGWGNYFVANKMNTKFMKA